MVLTDFFLMVAIRTVKVRGGSIFYVEMACDRLIFLFLDCQTVSFSFRKLNAATETQSTVDGEEFWRVSHASPDAN